MSVLSSICKASNIFKKRFFICFLLLFVFNTTHAAAEKIHNKIVIWNSEEGLRRLEQSKFKNDFYQLVNFYQPQMNPLYCAAASGTIVLNALNYGKIPSQKEFETQLPEGFENKVFEFPLYSQATFFNKKTDLIKKREIIDFKAPKHVSGTEKNYDPGLTLAEFSQILSSSYHLKTKTVYAEKLDEKSLSDFRQNLRETFSENKKFLIANFNGKDLGLDSNGHISPLAAYDKESDSVLVLDVALFKNQWYWVTTEDLYKAMNTKDGEQYRGYLVVRK